MPTLASAFISNIKCSSEKELRVRAKLIGWKGEKSKFTEVKSISKDEKVRLDVEVEKFVSARDAVNTFLRIEVLTPAEKEEEEEKDSKEEEETYKVLASTSIDLGTAAVNPEKQLDRDFSIRLCSSGEKENAVEMLYAMCLRKDALARRKAERAGADRLKRLQKKRLSKQQIQDSKDEEEKEDEDIRRLLPRTAALLGAVIPSANQHVQNEDVQSVYVVFEREAREFIIIPLKYHYNHSLVSLHTQKL